MNWRFVLNNLIFSLLVALGSLSTNIYSPLIVRMGEEFHSLNLVQASIPAFLVVFASVQFVSGFFLPPRKLALTIVIAATVYLAGSALAATASSIEIFLAARVVQGLGAGVIVVAVRTIAGNLYSGPQLDRALAIMNIGFAAVPALSPILGAAIAGFYDWRAVFVFCAGASIVLTSAFLMTEGRNAQPQIHEAAEASGIDNLKLLLMYAGASSLVYGVLVGFSVQGPERIIDEFGKSEIWFGVASSIVVAFFVLGSVLSTVVYGRFNRQSAFAGAVCACLVVSVVYLLVSDVAGVARAELDVAAMALFSIFLGVCIPASISGFIENFRTKMSIGVSIIGSSHLIGGAVASSIFVYTANAFDFSYALSMTLISAAATVFIAAYFWGHRPSPALPRSSR